MSARTLATAALACGAVLLAGGCGSTASTASTAGLRLQREDLVAVVRALQRTQPEAAAETAATKVAWQHVANGLPRAVGALPIEAVARARERAAALKLPDLFGELKARGLTGPGSALAGDYRSFVRLTTAGWRQIEFAIERLRSGAQPAAAFAQANVALYIESIYDAHFTLSQLGKQLKAGYAKLGGPAAFAHALTEAEVEALVRAYSEAGYRLHPHVGVRLGS